MRILFSLVLLGLASCNIQTSCLSKDSFITNYDTFVESLATDYKELPLDTWRQHDHKYLSYVDQCYAKYKPEMTITERVDFLKQSLTYQIYRGYNDKEYSDPSSLSLQQEMEELGEQGRVELENFIRTELKPDLENAIDDFVDEVEKIGDQLKDWLNKQ